MHSVSKSGLELLGRAGKQGDELAVSVVGDVEPLAGSAAVAVGEDGRRLRLVGLLGVVGRHVHVAGGEALAGGTRGRRSLRWSGRSRVSATALAGEVVFGGAEAAGEEDDVGAVEGDVDGRAEVVAVVADDGLEGDGDAEVVEAGGEVEGVGVLTMRREHLGANGDDFG